MKVTCPRFYRKWIQLWAQSTCSYSVCGTTEKRRLHSILTVTAHHRWGSTNRKMQKEQLRWMEWGGGWAISKGESKWLLGCLPNAVMQMYYYHSFEQAYLTLHFRFWLHHINTPALGLRNERIRTWKER